MKNLLFIVCISAVLPVMAQDEDVVMAPVRALFTGMHAGDSALVRSAFTDRPVMATVTVDAKGNTQVHYDDFGAFLKAIGTPHVDPWSEPIWDARIESDGMLAQVWAKYAFYIGKKFSHCGVDAFQLVRNADGAWRIFFVADTRRKEGCVVPDSIARQFK